jgi:hypothetical protein
MGAEIWLEPGGDFVQEANGDLKLAVDSSTSTDATRQRLYRTLMTNPRIIAANRVPVSAPDDLFHPDFGAGLPALVGQEIRFVVNQAQARIRRWLSVDPTIAQDPSPSIDVQQVGIGSVQINIKCFTKDGKPVTMSFPLGTPATPPAAGVPTP